MKRRLLSKEHRVRHSGAKGLWWRKNTRDQSTLARLMTPDGIVDCLQRTLNPESAPEMQHEVKFAAEISTGFRREFHRQLSVGLHSKKWVAEFVWYPASQEWSGYQITAHEMHRDTVPEMTLGTSVLVENDGTLRAVVLFEFDSTVASPTMREKPQWYPNNDPCEEERARLFVAHLLHFMGSASERSAQEAISARSKLSS